MINSIKELGFDEKISEFVDSVENSFNHFANLENSGMSMLDWINANVNALSEKKVLDNLTNRERFLFVFGILSTELETRLREENSDKEMDCLVCNLNKEKACDNCCGESSFKKLDVIEELKRITFRVYTIDQKQNDLKQLIKDIDYGKYD